MPAKKTRKISSKKDKNISTAGGLAVAMQTELEGYEFYKLAAAKCKDGGAKRMFNSLAKDELDHHRILRDRYRAIMEGRGFKSPSVSAKTRLRVKSPVFSKRFLQSKQKKHFEMSALAVGVLLEQNSIDFYNAERIKSPDPEIKKFFHELAVWEGEHLRALMAQRQFLQRALFADARFEPF